ncbi:MAG: UDP-2,3-diacylglucosamine diphosphatase [Gammaproteobacteria bacterium]|nr:UDP-2,3-diacylglucosamine diphosphatase [Gammaproteobacteria bacterium]
MAQAFIADLHLTTERPEAIALFEALLGAAVGQVDHLYILGDLFEYWIGDDAACAPEFAPVLAALKNATGGGLSISVMHGNRDFLLSGGFADLTGCRLLPDPYRLDLFGTPTLLSHGDALCTDDTDYMAMRRQVRDPRWQAQILARSIPERMAMARNLRQESGTATGYKPETIMDVNADAVRMLLRDHGLKRLIHGHTHRPGHYRVDTPTEPLERIVVGDWYEGSSLLVAGPGGLRLTAATDLVGAVTEVMRR